MPKQEAGTSSSVRQVNLYFLTHNRLPCGYLGLPKYKYAIFIVILFEAVFCAELLKLVTCFIIVYKEEGTAVRFKASLHSAVIKNKGDTVSIDLVSLEEDINTLKF